MINEIPKNEMPKWLLGEKYSFDIENIIKDSLYYPSCGRDGTPVKYFMGNIYSFVYVDYGISKNDFNKEIDLPDVFRGYNLYNIL